MSVKELINKIILYKANIVGKQGKLAPNVQNNQLSTHNLAKEIGKVLVWRIIPYNGTYYNPQKGKTENDK